MNQLANSLHMLSIGKGKSSCWSQTSACAIRGGFYTAPWGEPSRGRVLTGCRWTCVEELQPEPVAAEHVVSKRSNICTSLACCTGTSVKAGEARVCFHFQMCSAWVVSSVGWESSFQKLILCLFCLQVAQWKEDLFHIFGPPVHTFRSGVYSLTENKICKTEVWWIDGFFCNYRNVLPG